MESVKTTSENEQPAIVQKSYRFPAELSEAIMTRVGEETISRKENLSEVQIVIELLKKGLGLI